jgi:uncharacterized membrane protein YphA (DoxX/SURF4 family)
VVHELLLGPSPLREPLRSALLLPPRLAVGLGIALGFGVPKIVHFSPYLAEVRASGAPAPLLMALGLLVVELITGVALALGFATRLCGLALAAAMAGIWLIPSHPSIPWDITPFLLGGYLFALIGPGRYSVDALLHRPSPAPPASATPPPPAATGVHP